MIGLLVSSVVPILTGLITVYLLCLRHAAGQGRGWVGAQLVESIALTARNCFVDECRLAVYRQGFPWVARFSMTPRLVSCHPSSGVTVLARLVPR